MIILIGGEKGGTGKTTIATNLAAFRVVEKKEVLLVDTDRQESASSWCFVREQENVSPRISSVLKFGAGIRNELLELKRKYDDLIIDSGGRDNVELRSSLLVADIAIIPMRPTQFDLWSLSKLSTLLDEVKQVNPYLKTFVVINAASTNPSVKETNDAEEYMKTFQNLIFLDCTIKERIAFHKAAAEGKSVEEIKPLDQKAVDEMRLLYKVIFT